MAVSVPASLTWRRRRSTYKRRPVLTLVAPAAPERPAAHRAVHTAKQVAAIRRRRAQVLAVQGWVTSNARLIVAGVAAVAVFAATVVFLIGLADDRVRILLAVAAVIGFLAYSLHTIANYTTETEGTDA